MDVCAFSVPGAEDRTAIKAAVGRLVTNVTIKFNGDTDYQVAVFVAEPGKAAWLCEELETTRTIPSATDFELGFWTKPVAQGRQCTYNYACSWWWFRCQTKTKCAKYWHGRCTRVIQTCWCPLMASC